MKTESFLSYSYEPANGPYPEPVESSLQLPNIFL
jgi:hypothetical protein